MAMSPFVMDTPSSSHCADATKLPGSRPADSAAAPAPITPFFKNDRRFAVSFVEPSDCFIIFLLWFLGTIKSHIVLRSDVSLERQTKRNFVTGELLSC